VITLKQGAKDAPTCVITVESEAIELGTVQKGTRAVVSTQKRKTKLTLVRSRRLLEGTPLQGDCSRPWRHHYFRG
jgi:hypothetical protein